MTAATEASGRNGGGLRRCSQREKLEKAGALSTLQAQGFRVGTASGLPIGRTRVQQLLGHNTRVGAAPGDSITVTMSFGRDKNERVGYVHPTLA